MGVTNYLLTGMILDPSTTPTQEIRRNVATSAGARCSQRKSAWMVSSSDAHGIQRELLTNDQQQFFDHLFGKVQLALRLGINN